MIKIYYLLVTIYRIFKYLLSNTRRYSNILFFILLHRPKTILEIGVYTGRRAGEMIDAARAEQIGLINRSVDADKLTSETMALAEKIASKSSMTLAVGKRAFYLQAEMSLADAYNYASKVMVDNMLKQDAEEGIAAFVEKRTPNWQDK
mgnify:CR=1 FL=1